MSIDRVRNYLSKYNLKDKILEFPVSSATVELAAIALKTETSRIAKSLSFMLDAPIIIVTSGDMKIDNVKYKQLFDTKAKMLSLEDAENLIGHAVGGVCPFGINDNVKVYLDESLKRFDTVFPACGSSNSAIELTPNELETTCQNFVSWIDVCKPKE